MVDPDPGQLAGWEKFALVWFVPVIGAIAMLLDGWDAHDAQVEREAEQEDTNETPNQKPL